MNFKKWNGTLALLLALSLTGCGNLSDDKTDSTQLETKSTGVAVSESNTVNVTTETQTLTTASMVQTTETSVITTKSDELSKEELENQKKAEEEKRLKAEEEARKKAEEKAKKEEEAQKIAEQKNSFSMMYYLAITAEEIRTSKDNRIALENIYTSLLNDINPGSVDEITQDHLKNLRDIIKSYIQISTKRERLQFIYNQEKASAIRNAVPNPLAVLSVSNSIDWKKLALTTVYTAVDSYNNYKTAQKNADMSYIMSGWELDDEEKEAVTKNRDRAFDYMVDMVQEYNLDGLKTLNEKSIEKFAEISSTKNAPEKIKLLKSEESTYQLLGNYWLELADAYFETAQYSKCLDCVEQYEKLSTQIYRQDFNYLKVLPKVIVAAQESYTGTEYIKVLSKFADDIEENVSKDDWSLRYFAAQVYLDLYSKTSEIEYLNKVYDIASENVTNLLNFQRELNSAYLNDVAEQTVKEPNYRYMNGDEKEKAKKEYKEEKKRVKEYNKSMKEKRETELPSLYEPLVLNCELLFSLSDSMNNNSVYDKKEIEAILETANNGIFMVKPINDAYSFGKSDNKYTIDFDEDEIVIPANLLTADSSIAVTINENGNLKTYDDCVIKKVERKGKNIDNFKVYMTSKKLKKYDWTADSKIELKITYGDAYNKKSIYNFEVSKFEKHWYGNTVEFKEQ